MPTIFTHAVFAAACGHSLSVRRLPLRFWALLACAAMLPDADVLAFAFRVPYASLFGHRGVTHSIAFAVLVGCVFVLLSFQFLRTGLSLRALTFSFALATLSHPLLDMLTNGGLGVALFAPFSNARYFFPWRPIEVSPIGARFFSARGAAVLVSELAWVWLPSLGLWCFARLARKTKDGKRTAP